MVTTIHDKIFDKMYMVGKWQEKLPNVATCNCSKISSTSPAEVKLIVLCKQ